MSFKRNRAQLKCESWPGCNPKIDATKAQDKFRCHILTSQEADELQNCLLNDAQDFYYKGVLSFCEAIHAIITRNLYSWATVKLYYSVYYLIRCSLATKYIAVIRIKGLFYLRSRQGEQPKQLSGKSGNSTHQGTIKIFKRLFSRTDILQTNKIEGITPYLWLMDKRDQISYRERAFHDPDYPDFWEEFSKAKANDKFKDLLSAYINDLTFRYCFQSDHACLALPIQRILLTKQDLLNEGIQITFPNNKRGLLEDLLLSIDGPDLRNVIFDAEND